MVLAFCKASFLNSSSDKFCQMVQISTRNSVLDMAFLEFWRGKDSGTVVKL